MSLVLSRKGDKLLLHPSGVPGLHNAGAYGVRCCGGLCGCKCNIRPSGWLVEFTDINSTDGTLDCLAGNTYEIELGTVVEGSATLCGGSIVPCGPCSSANDPCVAWVSVGFFYSASGVSLCVGVKALHPNAIPPAHAPGYFFVQGCVLLGSTAFENDCLLGGDVTSFTYTISDFGHFSTHQFSATVTAVP